MVYLNDDFLENLHDNPRDVSPVDHRILLPLSRGIVDAVGERCEGLSDAMAFLGETDPCNTEVVRFARKLDAVGLHQIELLGRICSQLDETHIDAFLGEAIVQLRVKRDEKDINFKPRQRSFLKRFRDLFRGSNVRTAYAKYPTGVGKTWMIGLLLRAACMEKGKPVRALVLSPRNIVNEQNEKSIANFMPEGVTVGEVGVDADIHIGTYQSAVSEREDLDSFRDDYDIIVLDELHRGLSANMMRFLKKHYPHALILGFSATPYLGSWEDLSKMRHALSFFEAPVDEVPLPEACQDGDITPIRAVRVSTQGEFRPDGEEDLTDDELNKNADFAQRNALAIKIAGLIPNTEKGILFCSGVDHATALATAMQQQGFPAEVVHGKMYPKERRRILTDFKSGKIRFVCNADLLIEGFDDEPVAHAIMLRMTKAPWIYEQMIGRICRLDPKNPDKIATVWDMVGQHSGQCTLHGLAKFYGLIKGNLKNGEIVFPVGGQKPFDPDENQTESVDWVAEILKALGEQNAPKCVEVDSIARVRMMRDAAYYYNSDYVREDLEAYAKSAWRRSSTSRFLFEGLDEEQIDERWEREKVAQIPGIFRLWTRHDGAVGATATLCNGEVDVALTNYLNRALEMLDPDEFFHQPAKPEDAAIALFKIAGYEVGVDFKAKRVREATLDPYVQRNIAGSQEEIRVYIDRFIEKYSNLKGRSLREFRFRQCISEVVFSLPDGRAIQFQTLVRCFARLLDLGRISTAGDPAKTWNAVLDVLYPIAVAAPVKKVGGLRPGGSVVVAPSDDAPEPVVDESHSADELIARLEGTPNPQTAAEKMFEGILPDRETRKAGEIPKQEKKSILEWRLGRRLDDEISVRLPAPGPRPTDGSPRPSITYRLNICQFLYCLHVLLIKNGQRSLLSSSLSVGADAFRGELMDAPQLGGRIVNNFVDRFFRISSEKKK